jgi:hypothetical protein
MTWPAFSCSFPAGPVAHEIGCVARVSHLGKHEGKALDFVLRRHTAIPSSAVSGPSNLAQPKRIAPDQISPSIESARRLDGSDVLGEVVASFCLLTSLWRSRPYRHAPPR